MPGPTVDTSTRISTEGTSRILLGRPIPSHADQMSTPAVRRFIESFYPALQSARPTIASFYLPVSSTGNGVNSRPTIVFNGNSISDPAAWQTLFEKQMPYSYYEVQSYDCHVLNPDYGGANSGGDPSTSASPRRNMSISVTVSGFVRYGDGRDAMVRGFSDNVILVPNLESVKVKGGPKKDWLVQCQNFRVVV